MSWHHPDLYFFLCLLAGLAAFLASIAFRVAVADLLMTMVVLFGVIAARVEVRRSG